LRPLAVLLSALQRGVKALARRRRP